MDDKSLLSMSYPEDAKPLEVQDVAADRVEIYSKLAPKLKSGTVKGVLCDQDGVKVQHIVHSDNGKVEVVVIEEACKIMLDDLSPTQMVEYKFEDTGFMLGWMGEDAAASYRSAKFKAWKEMVDKPNCEAAFRRILQAGVVTRLYDTVALPTPPEQADKYIVTNEETGKKINIPHEVSEMRVWDAEAGSYKAFSAHLDGAPQPDEKEQFWGNLIAEQREKHGDELIDKILASK
eukprot:TRINITY_DN5206_c0_g2_i1.p1 TRINITY_DN5206_c0_g2~~TRINITY_DN5206_c0_g2_i1.p1  ORF type:complete len:233 (+),score=40.01 TRINITY_DN5206_c0_g2_i1:64-762(+)